MHRLIQRLPALHRSRTVGYPCPLGKLQSERMVPVDNFVCELVQRLRFFRSLDPLPADRWLLARPGSKVALVRQFRDYLHLVCHSLGLPTNIVPIRLDTPTQPRCGAPVSASPS